MTRDAAPSTLDLERAQRIARGDRDALELVLDEYGGAAWSLALRITRSEQLAEEATQDAFVRVWKQAATYDPNLGAFDSWVLQLVRTAAIDRVRHEARRRPRQVDGTPAATVDVSDVAIPARDDPFAAAWAQAQHRDAMQLLGELHEEHREVLFLAYYEGLSQSEIAERIDVPIGTVKTRTHRALTRLRDLIQARGAGDRSST
jgi:RNA polymerase sigma-70 factor (ECF subfamily)